MGSAFKNKGIQQLLDAVVEFLPSPLDVPPVEGKDEKGRSVHRDVDGPFAALAFKVMNDPYTGTLTFLRVYSGKLASGSAVYNVNAGKERADRTSRQNALESERRRKRGFCGRYHCRCRIKTYENRRYAWRTRIIRFCWNQWNFLDPVISVALESKSRDDVDKLSAALARLLREDPSLKVRVDHETGQTILSGMGELHLEIIVDRLLREFQVDARVGTPEVAYRETITKSVKQHYRHVKQTGGKGQFAEVVMEVEPTTGGQGLEFVDKITGGAIPREYIQPVHDGIRTAMESGVLAGYPMVDIKVTLTDGKFHEVDSSEMAFRTAGYMAFKGSVSERRGNFTRTYYGRGSG